jgi:SAM-dependent methyltransferase
MLKYIKYFFLRSRSIWSQRPRVILDGFRRLGNFEQSQVGYRTDIHKEQLSRDYVLAHPGTNLKFLDMGGKDGALTYLLGIRQNLAFDQDFYDGNKSRFDAKYEYFGVDLHPAGPNVLAGDVCSRVFLEKHQDYVGFFDVIYSNNVFEHLRRPWIAAKNLSKMLKPGGMVITVVPFSQRYHEDPQDFFRYTHIGIVSLFEDCETYETLEAGYDIAGRRTDWQGSGKANDTVPIDSFGAWRETWFTVSVLRKLPLTRATEGLM